MKAPEESGGPATDRWGQPLTGIFSVEMLRIGVGLIWIINLLFIALPSNHYFADFSQTALSFAPTSAGGPGLAQYAAAHALVFSWGIAVVTGYLALALVLGVTTRIACFVGSAFSAVLLSIQVGSTFVFPGGTDVGPHPLYILLYAVLIVGGAGRAFSLDLWLRAGLARWTAGRRVVVRRAFWTGPVDSRMVLTYFVVGTLLSLGVGFALVFGIPVAPRAAPAAIPSGPAFYENLTVSINSTNGWPEYSPANFSVPAGRVIFTIVDRDMPMNWSGCACVVRGTANNLELVNGSPTHVVKSSNVAHSFTVPRLGIEAWTPGQSITEFSVELSQTGTFVWICVVPCGTGSDPYNTSPMGVPGFMTGQMTVT